MGRAKQEMEEYYSLQISMPKNKDVCSHHFSNKDLQQYVLKNGEWGYCHYCNSAKRRVIDNGTLVKFMAKQVLFHYDSADNECIFYETAEGGYQGPTLDGDELLEDCDFDVDVEDLRQDIYACFNNTIWCKINPFDPSQHDVLMYDWEKFTSIVKHKCRFVFLHSNIHDSYYGAQISKILDLIARYSLKLGLISTIPIGKKIYRCRQHKLFNDVKTAADIAAPPEIACTYANRMSPAGISMFYGSTSKRTAIAETVNASDIKNPFYTVGIFSSKKSLTVLDLSKLPKVDSIFDEQWGEHLYIVLFFKDFVKDLTKSIVKSGREHIEYVPTQIVTEYLKYNFPDDFDIKIDGIIYPSSKVSGKCALVLFMNNEESVVQLAYDKTAQVTRAIS